ncbi:MAG TPA: sugar-binding protein [Chloroflexi bacterium]|nr:sugar-binding protein [Chloroflexota bacterium]
MPRLFRVLSLVALVAFLLPPPGESTAMAEPAGRLLQAAAVHLLPTQVIPVSPGQARRIDYEQASLEIGADALPGEILISITPLRQDDVPALDAGMTNITRGPRRGYRFQPHMRFRKKIRVTLPYDKALIPPGFTEQDVKTFYFDEQARTWRELERISVDSQRKVIVSLTDHFTDMINAVVAAPDPSLPMSYNPSSLKDIEAADPGEGINLIERPQVNNLGEARFSYPIQLPPGRDNMQPLLEVNYNSSSANGWMGLGWDIRISGLTIDTRWGVPRYDRDVETETYLLDDGQLTPLAHRGAPQVRTPEKVFHARVEGEFQRIIRHGSQPKNYWWEIVDKNGMRSFYGGDPQTNGPAADATLTDANGNIFKWALREVRDLNGNGVKYGYTRISDPGISGGTMPGSQLYLKTINYTQSNGAAGAFTVNFLRDSELPNVPNYAGLSSYQRRPDVMIDARGGFKMVTAALLKRIEVTFNHELVRRYDFVYQVGAFNKTLLQSISQSGEDGTVFNMHTFTYYDELLDAGGAYQGFGGPTDWSTGSDNVTAPAVPIEGQASALGGSVSTSVGGHLYVGFNLESPTKEGSGGGKVGFNYSSTDTVLEMIDLNGDELPDKVFKGGDGQVYFRLNRSGPGGTTAFDPPVPVTSLPAIARESSATISLGPELYLGVNVLYNHAETFTTSPVYFSDVNGDGLADLVNSKQVLFNHLVNGVPSFTLNSGDTPVPVGSGAVDSAGVISDYTALYEKEIDSFPLVDTVRRWVAPYDGQIQITGNAALIPDTSPERGQYQTADGVRVAIQQNGSELWMTQVAADDYGPKTPTGVDAISVRAGDRIYFRVQSVFDGRYDAVAWDPQITYLNIQPTTDVNGLNPYAYQASADFVLAGRRDLFAVAPLTGTVRLAGTLHKLGQTTDDTTLLVLKNGTPLFSQTLAWNETGDFSLPPDFEVLKGDKIQLRVKVDSPIDLRQLQWTASLFYVSTPVPGIPLQDSSGAYLLQLHPPYDIDMYPASNLTAPQQAWSVPQTGTLTVVSRLSAVAGDANGVVTLTVKRQNALVAKRTIAVSHGVVQNVQFNVDVTQGDQVYFDYSVYDPALAGKLSTPTVVVAYGDPNDSAVTSYTPPSALHSAVVPGLFAEPYRGWTYAGYNGNRDRASRPIDEARLVLSDVMPPRNPDGTVNYNNYNPVNAGAYPFTPFPQQGYWRGPADLSWVAGDEMSSSRLGPAFVSVPQANNFAGSRAVARLSRTSQDAVAAGLGPLGGSFSSGISYGEVDFLDMNGDGFPDIVGNGHIQYTNSQGGLEASNRALAGLGHVRDSDDFAQNIDIGGNAAMFKANARGEVNTSGRGAPKENRTGSQMALLGFGGSLGNGTSDIQTDLIDINGDGLPDRVSQGGSQLRVALNLGYGFAPTESWGSAAINAGASRDYSLGAGVGFNGGIYDFAGGVSFDKNQSQAGCQGLDLLSGSCTQTGQILVDLNNDGLPDQVSLNGNRLRVAFNTGNGFAPEADWTGAMSGGIDTSANVSAGGGLYFTIGIGPLCLPLPECYIIINPGGDGSQSMARQETALLDVDGDGYPDHISSTGDSSMTVARNRTGRTNLLKSVQRPLGATIDLDYQRNGNTYDQPQSRWVLSRVSLFDGTPGDGVDTQVTTYQYENGFYNRLEREFYGYQRVTEVQRDASNGEIPYRTIVREYANNSFFTQGLLTRELTQDAAGHPFIETQNTYSLVDTATGQGADPQSTTAAEFPQLVRTDRRFYEGSPTPGKSTYTTFRYDAFGNMTQMFDAGDVGAGDDVQADIDYSACTDNYVVDQPTKNVVSSNGAVLRHREATVDCATGDVTQIRQYLENGEAAVIDLVYFPNGNVQRVTGPSNNNGQRYEVLYEYDPTVQTHITKITDSFGYISTATYNLKYGEVETVTDTNDNPTAYVYDAFGRLASVTGPYEQSGPAPTIRFEYHPQAAVPWAIARHLDVFRGPAATIDTVVFVDGLDRVLQTKKSGTVFAGPDAPPQDVLIVSGRVNFDFVGRLVEAYYPVTESLGMPGVFNPTYDSIQSTRTTYDLLDRTTRITLPDNTSTTLAYAFGPDRSGATQFETSVTDANGNLKKTYYDVRELVTAVKEFNQGGSQVIWTSYAYNPVEEITRVIDDRNNITGVTYDSLGRQTSIDSPDAGKTEFIYDLASNLVARITPNLRAEGRQITYDYDFNRLTTITYPDFPGNSVSYTYGAFGAAHNRAGRITLIADESGTQELFYGKLGEIVREIKTIASATEGTSAHSPEVYTTQYVYDTWGRLQTLTYPDGELLTYSYDSGGLVRQATGVKGSFTYNYINRLEYDKFQDRAFVEAGNGVRTTYTYDPSNRRLDNLIAGAADGSPFQNVTYTYDRVGNLLTLANDVPVPPASQYGGPMTETFRYDALYRLTGASGTYQFMPDKRRQYSLSLAYDSIHNLVSKQQTDQIMQPPGRPITQKPTTYTSAYSYGGPQPHAPTHFGDRTFTYDHNGNQTGWTNDLNGTRRTIVWDEENRIQSIFDNGQQLIYKYNDAGERVVKRGPLGEIAFVNPYFTIRNREIGTKHIYADATRVVSKLVKSDDTFEQGQFFYHSSDQGSINYVTDANGGIYEHLEYFPFGETWIHEAGDTHLTPYLFAGKEQDEATGLYYFGARYYDPRTSVWQSTDPVLDDYLNGERSGGVYDASNLNLYAYSSQNPTTYIDLDGRGKVKKVKKVAKTSLSTGGIKKATAKKTKIITINLSKAQYPETAQHIADSIKKGHPSVVTINRPGAKANRRASLKGIPTKKGTDRDEWPMAMFKEGGTGAHIRHIDPSDNRGAGSCIAHRCAPYPDGTVIQIKIVP